jgi:hypothetical protein
MRSTARIAADDPRRRLEKPAGGRGVRVEARSRLIAGQPLATGCSSAAGRLGSYPALASARRAS